VYIYIYIAPVLKRLTTPSVYHIPLPSIVPFAHPQIPFTHRCIYPILRSLSPIAVYIPSSDPFHPSLCISHTQIPFTHRCIYPILRSLSPIAVYIPSFRVLRGRPHFSHPPGFQLIMIFGNRVGSILSTWPYQIELFSGYLIQCRISRVHFFL
jgi:hypothetical protein